MILGGSGKAVLYGGVGDDTVEGNNSHSRDYGGNGDDTLSLSFVQSQTGSGAALFDGGTGQDVLRLTLFPTTTSLTLDL